MSFPEPSPCLCGERGENSANCKFFGHGPIYAKAKWHYPGRADQDALNLTNVEKAYAVDDQGGFYFWDETGADCFGPFATLDNAREGVCAYARDVL